MGIKIKEYIDHSIDILTNDLSVYKPNRTGVDTISRFGARVEYDLSDGLPLLTTKKMYTRGVIEELLWFLDGDTNVKRLVDNNVHIWTDNAFQRYLRNENLDERYPMYSQDWRDLKEDYVHKIKTDKEFAEVHGELGPVYGAQWRRWRTPDGGEVDQIADVIDRLNNSPQSRRIILNAWNVGELPDMELPPCHVMYQFNVRDDKLDCQMYQRSADTFLGVPFNIASTSILTHILAQEADLKPGVFSHVFGDAHFYCGRGDRGKWYGDNINEIKERIKNVDIRQEFLDVADWIEENAPREDVDKDKERLDHIPAILEQSSRKPKELPILEIKERPFEKLTADDFEIRGYEHHPPIRRAMAV